MLRNILIRTILLLVFFIVVYLVFLHFDKQRQEKNRLALDQVELVQLSLIQDYNVLRGFSLLDQGDSNSDVKKDQFYDLLKKEYDLSTLKNVQDSKESQQLYESTTLLIEEKKKIVQEYEKSKKMDKDRLNVLMGKYIDILEEYQSVTQKLKK